MNELMGSRFFFFLLDSQESFQGKNEIALLPSQIRSSRDDFFSNGVVVYGKLHGARNGETLLASRRKKDWGDEVEKLPCHAATSSPSLISLWPH
jgi:hypothetical protein